MFPSRSTTHPGTHILTAPHLTPEAVAARTARHLSLCQELADLAIMLARAAAQQAAIQLTPAPADATPSDEAAPVTKAPAHRPPDAALTFTRLARVVRDTVALEARLAAPTPAHTPLRPAGQRTAPLPDHRRATVKRALALSLANHPDRASLTAETNAHLEETLAGDPGLTLSTETVLITIANAAEIMLDYGRMPDDLLDLIIEHADADPP